MTKQQMVVVETDFVEFYRKVNNQYLNDGWLVVPGTLQIAISSFTPDSNTTPYVTRLCAVVLEKS